MKARSRHPEDNVHFSLSGSWSAGAWGRKCTRERCKWRCWGSPWNSWSGRWSSQQIQPTPEGVSRAWSWPVCRLHRPRPSPSLRSLWTRRASWGFGRTEHGAERSRCTLEGNYAGQIQNWIVWFYSEADLQVSVMSWAVTFGVPKARRRSRINFRRSFFRSSRSGWSFCWR